MKKILYLFLTVSLIFSSCSKEKDNVTSINGCTNATACNYNSNATMDDGSCDLPNGCGNPLYVEYDAAVTCSDNTACITLLSIDIRDQLVGEYSGAATMTLTDLSSMDPTDGSSLVTFRCEKSGSSNIDLILEGFGLYAGEDVIISCNQITEVAGGLTFAIIEKDGIIMLNPDGSSGPAHILNGESGPQTYTSAEGDMSFSFTMENAQWMYEVTAVGTN